MDLNHFAFILFLIIGGNGGFAKTITVCSSCEVKTIKQALELASDGDTILVKPGIYKEANIKINKSISLIGEGKPTIDGEEKGEIITIGAPHVTVDGFLIKNVGNSFTKDYAAVRIANTSGFTIQNLELNNLYFGIYLQKAEDGKVLNNIIKGDAQSEFNSGNGIHLWKSSKVEIAGNDVQRVRDGIYLEFSDQVHISNNTSKYNVRYGLHFMFSNNNYARDNYFETNGAGIALMFSRDMELTGNVIRKNWGTAAYGVLLKEINNAVIAYNTFELNTVAVTVDVSTNIDYFHNDFISNGYGLRIRGASYNSKINNNNFLYNSFDLAYNGKLNGNNFDGNYWSGYTGYDLDRNGIGDVPYRPVKLFSYVVNRSSQAIILMRSLFIDIIDFSEKVSPIFTPDNLFDEKPKMKKINHDRNK
ncbi:MAG TPA: nitrous oxide reductase family maturation protein NosD [Flavobacteriaceae bacterium]|nr:nitrous oxide reductase family maturation protein NosD [Flavobacteriaceae bacterium]